MSVYVILFQHYDNCEVLGVWSTKEQAKARVDELLATEYKRYSPRSFSIEMRSLNGITK